MLDRAMARDEDDVNFEGEHISSSVGFSLYVPVLLMNILSLTRSF